jgi:hypothetical protein
MCCWMYTEPYLCVVRTTTQAFQTSCFPLTNKPTNLLRSWVFVFLLFWFPDLRIRASPQGRFAKLGLGSGKLKFFVYGLLFLLMYRN